MIKKAVIMAAGKGTRMLPLTKEIPKQLIDINGKPFLFYLLSSLQKAGYEEFGIIASHKKEKIAEFVKEYGFDARIIDQGGTQGTAYAVRAAEDFVDGEDFIVLGGDNLWSVEDLSSMNREDEYSYIAGYEVAEPSKYGVLVEKDGNLIRIHEKPDSFVGNLINSGLYKFTPEIFEIIKGLKESPRGEYELTDAISVLAKRNKMRVLPLQDFWLDLGCIEDIPKVSKFIKEHSII